MANGSFSISIHRLPGEDGEGIELEGQVTRGSILLGLLLMLLLLPLLLPLFVCSSG